MSIRDVNLCANLNKKPKPLKKVDPTAYVVKQTHITNLDYFG